MSIDTLYLSRGEHDLTNKPDKVFLTAKNIKSIINKVENYNCITSIEDLGCENILYAVDNSNKIVLFEIDDDYVLNINNDINFGFFNFINLAQQQQKLTSELTFLTKIDKQLNSLTNTRTNNSPILWTAGCSFTYGFGVDPNQRYGAVLSELLNLDEVILAKNGSSIFWAADQILRSDIKKDDIVVWGITNSARINYNDKFNLESATVGIYKDIKDQLWDLNYFDSVILTISNYKQILQVINYCNKIGAKLYLVNLLDQSLISLLLTKYSNFINLVKNYDSSTGVSKFLDYGSDNWHPGPRQHRHYADQIYQFIKRG